MYPAALPNNRLAARQTKKIASVFRLTMKIATAHGDRHTSSGSVSMYVINTGLGRKTEEYCPMMGQPAPDSPRNAS